MTFGGPHCFHLHSVGASARAGRIAKAKAKSAGGLHVLSPRAFTASHLSLARHERLAVAAIVLLRKARSATVGGRSDTPARTRDDDAIRWAGRLISHDMCHYSGMPTCKVGLGGTRQSGTPRPMQHDSSNLSSSSSSKTIIGAYRVSVTFRLLPNPTRHGPPSHASDPDVMSASDVRLGEGHAGRC